MSRSIRDYFSVRDGLPDPNGSLSSQVSSRAIVLANKEVEKSFRRKETARNASVANTTTPGLLRHSIELAIFFTRSYDVKIFL